MHVLLDTIASIGERFLPFDKTVRQWQNRVLSLRHWNPDAGWPDVRTEQLLLKPKSWLSPYLHEVKSGDDLKKLPLLEILHHSLGFLQQQQLDLLAPERLLLPSGSRIRLEYAASGEPPVLAARLQELFGWSQTPCINEGKVPVLIHLLSPGFKPVQVTQDLKNFWNHTYHEVKKELKRRYPRHHWPDDPWNAQAVKGVPRKK